LEIAFDIRSFMTSARLYSSLFAGAAVLIASGAFYWSRSHRRTPEQQEQERRRLLNRMGRITDGTVIDVREIGESEEDGPIQLLIYTYDVGGVSYECSQDVTSLRPFLDLHTCRIGLPTSIKYDPHNPGNSIVVAEGWIGPRQQFGSPDRR
jgi:hypothetical protein